MSRDPVKRFLKEAELEQIDACVGEADLKRIEACVEAAERRTRGEIVVVVAPASHHYPVAGMVGGAALAIPLAVVLTRLIGRFAWAGPHDLWIFLGVVLPLFFLCRAALERFPRLKRLFVSPKEMDQEVREAAAVQFFSKGLYRTREETGVLIYLSLFECRVRVLGDRGIDAVAPAGFWREIVDQIVAGIKMDRRAEAICKAVGRICELLEEKFPAVPGDTNELPDLIVEP
jgi:putative membrane protein